MTHTANIVDQFIGAWTLLDWTATATDGSVTHPYGEQPAGRIMYQPEGTMSAHLMRRDRTRFASEDRHRSTPEEREAAYREYMAYYGTFTVQESRGTVTHRVEGSTFSNWIGTDLVRSYEFAEDRLTLSLTRPDGTLHQLFWQRIAASVV